MGAQMLAANQGAGMKPGPAFGRAAMGTMGHLAGIEKASADQTFKNKQLELQEERNRIARETAQEKSQLMKQKPQQLKDGVWWHPLTGVRTQSIDPLKAMMAAMMGGGMNQSQPSQAPTEGTRARNPQTNEVLEYRNGRWIPAAP